MSEVKMLTAPVPNVPWQERPQGPQNGAPIWRYSENPIIGRNPLKGVARIFNSAVMPYGDAFIGVFRGEQTNGIPYIYLGHSKDATHCAAHFHTEVPRLFSTEGTVRAVQTIDRRKYSVLIPSCFKLIVTVAKHMAADIMTPPSIADVGGCAGKVWLEIQ